MSRLADLAIANYMNQYVSPQAAVEGDRTGTTRTTPTGPVVTTPTNPDAPTTTGNTGTNGNLSDLAFGTPRGIGGTGYAGYNYTGFDFTQDAANRDIGKSAKYAFANATDKMGQAGVTADQWGTKAGAQEVAIKYIVPEMEALGYKVLEVKGEKVRIVTFEDYQKGNTKGTWVDWVVNADGAALGLTPQLAFQVETPPDATDTGTSWTRPADTTASTTPASTTTPTTSTTTTPPASTTSSAFVDDELMRGRSLADLVY